jgi:hypothetical protein
LGGLSSDAGRARGARIVREPIQTTMSMHSDEEPPTQAMADRGGMAAGNARGAAASLVHAQVVAAASDLERLLVLLDQAGGELMRRFADFERLTGEISREAAGTLVAGHATALRDALLGATTAMQFQDMSTQLVEHALSELRTIAHRLGDDASLREMPPASGIRSGPVSQSGMGAGSIDLF